MNRTALKTYAPKARLDFIRAVTDRAAFFGLTPNRAEPMQETGDVVIIGGRAFPKVVAQQRRSLEARIQRLGFDQVMEAMAYTWFNRFVALRYMELHGYLDHGYRVLSQAPVLTAENSKNAERNPVSSVISAFSVVNNPEILDHAEHVALPGLDPHKVIELKLDGGQDAVLYRLLLVAQCNALNEAMPFLFEKIADETELLLPDNLLHSDSVIRKLVNEIEEADWQQVEIIGWLYQFYISDKKDEVIGKVVKSEDIPAATQLFTPNWIVKYLVQNTLGRQWLATYPDSPLRQQMEYYIEPAEQTEEVEAQLTAITPKSLDPETLTLLDDACGSGHILVEAYDVFKAIYQERGYRSKDIPRLILEKNLFGLEIDDRAAQLAAFALLMKARADDRRIFAERIQPNIVAIQESKGLENLLTPDPGADAVAGDLPFSDNDLFPDTQKQLTLNKPTKGSPLASLEPCLRELIKLFEHGKTFGSLIRVPQALAAQLPTARQHIEAMIAKGQLWEHRAAALLLPLVKQAELLAKTYDAAVTNPPYMGSKFFNPVLKPFVETHFPEGCGDLYGCFMQRALAGLRINGTLGMITIPNWMFLATFHDLRRTLLTNQTIDSFIHNGRGVWGSDFGSCSFVLRNRHTFGFRGVYRRLFDKQGSVASVEELARRFFQNTGFVVSQDEFRRIPSLPLAYWVSDTVRDAYGKQTIGMLFQVKEGLGTRDDDIFLRRFWEISIGRVRLGHGVEKWVKTDKAGGYRKWAGNLSFVMNWDKDGNAIKNHRNPDGSLKSRPQNTQFFFRPAVTWGKVGVGPSSFRLRDTTCAFNDAAPSAFGTDLHYALGLLNSKVFSNLLLLEGGTLNVTTGIVGRLPYLLADKRETVESNVERLVEIAQSDWDSFETSWGFQRFPLLREQNRLPTVLDSFQLWSKSCEEVAEDARNLEEENNAILIQTYGLTEELSPEVTRDTLSVRRSDREEDLKRLISYAIGCMMGRYSLDRPGLVYAHSRNESFDPSLYGTFPADADGIIPITELAWFPDDATERFVEFIAKAWPREHLEENLKFIADSLGANRDEHPRDTIRRYLATGFYKDHLSTYKKRPIYWLFSSGNQRAFQCLVYLHRYHEGTLARMRTEYVIPLQGKLSHRIEQLAGDIAAATSTSRGPRAVETGGWYSILAISCVSR